MNQFIKLFVLVFVLVGCSLEEPTAPIDPQQQDLVVTQQHAPSVASPSYSQDQLVVKYPANTPEIKKQQLRAAYRVFDYKTCACADDTIELWTFVLGSLTIEGKLGEIETDPDLEGAEFQYYINNSGPLFNAGSPSINMQLDLMKSANTGVTIAIIDSGLDYTYKGFMRPFLFNRRQEKPCRNVGNLNDYSGWDFVNGDNNIYDDNGHGTVVTYLMYKKMMEQNVDFQILPIKAFNENGEGNYFDILCAFQYAVGHTDVDIVNLSLGWYSEEFTILKGFIDYASQVLLVSSAGNMGLDTESNLHYPSSYEHDNIVTVAAMNTTFTDLWLESNYGVYSIDVAAPGEDLSFLTAGGMLQVSGTSFSNSYVTARAAYLYVQGEGPVLLKNNVINSGQTLSILDGRLRYDRMID
mgnify:CR=1 FL=1